MFRRLAVYTALVLFGVIIGAVGIYLLLSWPFYTTTTSEMHRDNDPRAPTLVKLDYEYPRTMKVGEVRQIRMHVLNLGVVEKLPPYRQPQAALIKVTIDPAGACKAVPITPYPRIPMATQLNVTTSLGWVVAANGAGDCALVASTYVGPLISVDPLSIEISDRWDPTVLSPIIAAAIGAVVLLFLGLRERHPKTLRLIHERGPSHWT